MSVDVIGPCLSPRLMAIGHRLSPLYFFCSPALSFQVSHWSSALRHRIIYCCQESQGRGEEGKKGGQREDVLQREANGEAGTLDCQISGVEYLMEPGVFI